MANRKNLELICEISEALLRPLELEAICEKILEYIFYNLKRINSCAILMIDKNSNNIYKLMDKARGYGNKGDVNYSRSIARQVANEGKAVIIADLGNEGEIEPSESMDELVEESTISLVIGSVEFKFLSSTELLRKFSLIPVTL